MSERLQAVLAGLPVQAVETADRTPTFTTERDALHAVLERLRDEGGFETITLVTCVDHFGGRRPEPRFEVVHQLYSLAHTERVRVKTRVSADDASVPSCVDLWPGAAFMEREAYDMFGVRFEGHENLRRLLMPDGYGHHPLRKEFPHQGIEPDRLYREWDRERRAQEEARNA